MSARRDTQGRGERREPVSNEAATALEKIARAEKAVDDLCSGKLRWQMRVPAEPDHDPDLIISEALRAARHAINVAGVTRLAILDEIGSAR